MGLALSGSSVLPATAAFQPHSPLAMFKAVADHPRSLHYQPVQMDWAIFEPAPCIECNPCAGKHRHVGNKLAGVAFIWLQSSAVCRLPCSVLSCPLPPQPFPSPGLCQCITRRCGSMHTARSHLVSMFWFGEENLRASQSLWWDWSASSLNSRYLIQPPCSSRHIYSRLSRTQSRWLLATSKDRVLSSKDWVLCSMNTWRSSGDNLNCGWRQKCNILTMICCTWKEV